MQPERHGIVRRLLWFIGLWLAGMLTVGAVAMLLRLALHG